MADRFTLSEFLRDQDRIAGLVLADDLFSLLNRQVTVPPGCVALVWGEAGPPAAARPGQALNAASTRQVLFVRAAPCELEYEVPHLRSSDGFEVTAALRLTVEPATDRAELAAFHQAVSASVYEVRRAHLHRHCETAVHAACAEVARQSPAAQLVAPTSPAEFAVVVAAQLQPLTFASGLLLGPDLRVSFNSAEFTEATRAKQTEERRERQQAAEKQLQEAAAQMRRQRLAELSALLDDARRIQADHPELSMSDIIHTFAPAQRSALHEALLAQDAGQRETVGLIVVAGEEVLWFDLADPGQPKQRVSLASEAGPLRSIRSGQWRDRPVLLVGARRGVQIIDPEGQRLSLCLLPTQHQPRGGFNAAVLLGDRVYATHSEVGLACWPLVGSPDSPAVPDAVTVCLPEVTRGAAAVRDLQTDAGDCLWFSVDHRIVGWRPSEPKPFAEMPALSEVTALVVAEGFVHAGTSSGAIQRWSTAMPQDAVRLLRGPGGRRVQSLDWLQRGGIPRLLIADDQFGLDALLTADSGAITYRDERRIRWGWAAADWIVGVNDSRDAVVLWASDAPESPAATIPVGRYCGRSIQDALLAGSATRGICGLGRVGEQD